MEDSAAFLFIWGATIHTTKFILDFSLLFCPCKGVTQGKIQKISLYSSVIDWDSVLSSSSSCMDNFTFNQCWGSGPQSFPNIDGGCEGAELKPLNSRGSPAKKFTPGVRRRSRRKALVLPVWVEPLPSCSLQDRLNSKEIFQKINKSIYHKHVVLMISLKRNQNFPQITECCVQIFFWYNTGRVFLCQEKITFHSKGKSRQHGGAPDITITKC